MAARQVNDLYRTFTFAGMFLVSAVAAILSFSHIQSLALRYGWSIMAADLLPLSIDGTIVVSSMSMLRAARSGQTAHILARIMLILAIGATLACNLSYGLPRGIPGALLSGWPAVAFTGCAELLIGMSRRRIKTPVTISASEPVKKPVTTPEPDSITIPDNPGGRLGRMLEQETMALTALSAEPDMGYPELASALGVSESTARRVKARLNGRAPKVTA